MGKEPWGLERSQVWSPQPQSWHGLGTVQCLHLPRGGGGEESRGALRSSPDPWLEVSGCHPLKICI